MNEHTIFIQKKKARHDRSKNNQVDSTSFLEYSTSHLLYLITFLTLKHLSSAPKPLTFHDINLISFYIYTKIKTSAPNIYNKLHLEMKLVLIRKLITRIGLKTNWRLLYIYHARATQCVCYKKIVSAQRLFLPDLWIKCIL
jgi:hypothetical protein